MSSLRFILVLGSLLTCAACGGSTPPPTPPQTPPQTTPTTTPVVSTAAAQPDARTAACEAARDRALPWMEQAVAEAVGSVPAEKRAEIEAEGQRELELFRTRFVDVCREMPDADVSCLDSIEKNRTKPCRDSLRPVWDKVYAGHLGR